MRPSIQCCTDFGSRYGLSHCETKNLHSDSLASGLHFCILFLSNSAGARFFKTPLLSLNQCCFEAFVSGALNKQYSNNSMNTVYIHIHVYTRTHFRTAEEFKYLGTTLTIQNSIREEIKSRLRSGNACYHSVQNLLSSRLLSRKLKIKIYRSINLPVVLYGCEAWSLTLREERKLRVFENMVLRRIFGGGTR